MKRSREIERVGRLDEHNTRVAGIITSAAEILRARARVGGTSPTIGRSICIGPDLASMINDDHNDIDRVVRRCVDSSREHSARINRVLSDSSPCSFGMVTWWMMRRDARECKKNRCWRPEKYAGLDRHQRDVDRFHLNSGKGVPSRAPISEFPRRFIVSSDMKGRKRVGGGLSKDKSPSRRRGSANEMMSCDREKEGGGRRCSAKKCRV